MKDALLLIVFVLRVCKTATNKPASVTASPSFSQYFEYFEKISMTCDQLGSDWMVWRFTSRGGLSPCGTGWGVQTPSGCDVKTVKPSDTGQYWCESRHRQSSPSINVTVTDGPVVLQSPLLPPTAGEDVTLRCQTRTTSDLSADFYKDGALLEISSLRHMTIHQFSTSHEGEYSCGFKGVGKSPSSWLRIAEDVTPPTLAVSPDSSQVFEYRTVSLSCGGNGSGSGWTVHRFTHSGRKMSICGKEWGRLTPDGCILDTAKQLDSATYWCEFATRRSNSANITVYDRAVILQTPVLPVMEGHEVTLHCKTTKASKLPARFYKDDSLISTEPTGHMTIHQVTRHHEGLYRCNIIGVGESPPSWLFISGVSGSPGPPHPLTSERFLLLRYVIIFTPYIASTVLMVSLLKKTGRRRVASITRPAPPSEDEDGDGDEYENDDVTTEHHF